MNTMTPAKACPFSNAAADFDPFDLTDPFPFYAFARDEAPVFFSDRLGYWVVSRHADIKAVFDNWQVFSSENAQAPIRPMGEPGRAVMKAGGFTPIPVCRPACHPITPASARSRKAVLARAASNPSSRRSMRS